MYYDSICTVDHLLYYSLTEFIIIIVTKIEIGSNQLSFNHGYIPIQKLKIWQFPNQLWCYYS